MDASLRIFIDKYRLLKLHTV